MTAMTAVQNSGEEVWLTPRQAAPILGVQPRSMRRYGDSRKLTVRRTLGGHRRYLEKEIRSLAAQLQVPAQVAS